MQVEDTPLIYACRAGNSDVIAMLINDGADTNAKNRVSIIMHYCFASDLSCGHYAQSGLTPLMCAIESRSVQAVRYLLNGRANVHLVEPVELIDVAAHMMVLYLSSYAGFSVDSTLFRSQSWQC